MLRRSFPPAVLSTMAACARWQHVPVGGLCQDVAHYMPLSISGRLLIDLRISYYCPGDGYTFGVKDAIDEFAARRGIRVYQTTEVYLPSFYFLKC